MLYLYTNFYTQKKHTKWPPLYIFPQLNVRSELKKNPHTKLCRFEHGKSKKKEGGSSWPAATARAALPNACGARPRATCPSLLS